MEQKPRYPAVPEASTAEMACIAEVGDILHVGSLQFCLYAQLMPGNTPCRVAVNLPQACQEPRSHASDPSLVHPSESSFGGCLGEFALQIPWGVGWFVALSQAKPLLEFPLGHVGGEGFASIFVLGIPAPDLPGPIGQRFFDCVYAPALPVKAELLI